MNLWASTLIIADLLNVTSSKGGKSGISRLPSYRRRAACEMRFAGSHPATVPSVCDDLLGISSQIP
jgi:hypothetical protein